MSWLDEPVIPAEMVANIHRWAEESKRRREARDHVLDAARYLYGIDFGRASPTRIVDVTTYEGAPHPLQTAVGFITETALDGFLAAHSHDRHLALELHGERLVCVCACGAFWVGDQHGRGDVFQL